MTKLSFTIDPDEMDNLIAYELRGSGTDDRPR